MYEMGEFKKYLDDKELVLRKEIPISNIIYADVNKQKFYAEHFKMMKEESWIKYNFEDNYEFMIFFCSKIEIFVYDFLKLIEKQVTGIEIYKSNFIVYYKKISFGFSTYLSGGLMFEVKLIIESRDSIIGREIINRYEYENTIGKYAWGVFKYFGSFIELEEFIEKETEFLLSLTN